MNCRFSIIVLAAFVATIQADYMDHLLDSRCGVSDIDRIMGGENATLGEFPWMARIGYSTPDDPEIFYNCGGVLIGSMHVLTAARCLYDLEPDAQVHVLLGEFDTESESDCQDDNCANPTQIFKADEIIIHEHFDSAQKKYARYDIAIVVLDWAVAYTDWVKPICVPYGDLLSTKLNDKATELAGWGRVDAEGNKLPLLQKLEITVVNMKMCERKLKVKERIRRQICAGTRDGRDSCVGDAGGPMMNVLATPSGPRYFVLGIISTAVTNCGESPALGLYTDVIEFADWIYEKIRI